MNKNKFGLSFRITVIFAQFLIITITLSGILTYRNQINIYKKQCEQSIRNIGEYLAGIMEKEGEDFAVFQKNFMEYYPKMHIPIGFSEYMTAQTEFYDSITKIYPSKTFGKDISFDDLSDELKIMYLEYNYEYWTLLFEQAREDFNIPYSYYLLMDDTDHTVTYFIDGERTVLSDHTDTDYPNAIVAELKNMSKYEIEEMNNYMYLADKYYNDPQIYDFEWATWEAGKPLDGYQVWDNDWGHTYAYYTPLIVNGGKLGLVGTEIEVARVNEEILKNSLQQIGIISVILIICFTFAVMLINRRYVRRLVDIDEAVRKYTLDHSIDVTGSIEKNVTGSDEISTLSKGLVAMITEIKNYIEKLTEARQETREMQELANRDALTGIRNKTAYDAEIKNIQFEMESGLIDTYGIAIADLNFLKRINDNYGHDKGNIAIKRICSIVCTTFAHSPVFRIGGDEFAIILKGNDLRELDALLYKFKDVIKNTSSDESLEHWERVSASIGYAIYDPQVDSSADNVFKRADAAMYRDKKTMKAIRAD